MPRVKLNDTAVVTHPGTQSAGDFVTSQDYLHEALRSLPGDWYRKNLQVVVKTHVVTGAAGPPQTAAIHLW